jgi:acetyl esterase
MLEPVSARIVEQMNASGLPPMSERTPELMRAMAARSRGQAGDGPEMHDVREVTFPAADGSSLRALLLVPQPDAPGVIVFYHSGGWVVGEIEEFEVFGRVLAQQTGCAVVLAAYRKAPEHRFPIAVDDSWDTLRWAAENKGSFARDDASLIVVGASAGGTLAAVMAIRARDAGLELALQVLVYPVTDADFTTSSYEDPANQLLLDREAMIWFWDHYLPDVERRSDSEASPLRAPSLAGVAPAVVLTAEHDPLRDEGVAYAQKLEQDGVAVQARTLEGQMHGFFTMVNVLPGSAVGIDYVAGAIRGSLVEKEQV